MKKRIISSFILIIMTLNIINPVYADYDVKEVQKKTAEFVHERVENPTVASIGGEWAVIGLARGAEEFSNDYYDLYLKNAREYIKKKDGVLTERRFTEYSRVVIALSSLGQDPKTVMGYDLTMPLSQYENVVGQGLNGAVWALITMNTLTDKTEELKNAEQLYLRDISEAQNDDGGWALSKGRESETDITAMTLTALSKYKNTENISEIINGGLKYLYGKMSDDGDFGSAESCAQVIIALCEQEDEESFKLLSKNSKTPVDGLMKYYDENGGFYHMLNDEKYNQMATEQALLALDAVVRKNEKKTALFNMSDTTPAENEISDNSLSLHKDIKRQERKYDKNFDDINESFAVREIKELADRGIVNGKDKSNYEPSGTMTRAEFAAIVTRALGLLEKSGDVFSDCGEKDWFYGYVMSAYSYGLVKGVSDTRFNPNGTITREEASVMIARAASLCGHKYGYSAEAVRDILSEYADYNSVSDWAKEDMSFCREYEILPEWGSELKSQKAVSRDEIAFMVYRLLDVSNLL